MNETNFLFVIEKVIFDKVRIPSPLEERMNTKEWKDFLFMYNMITIIICFILLSLFSNILVFPWEAKETQYFH